VRRVTDAAGRNGDDLVDASQAGSPGEIGDETEAEGDIEVEDIEGEVAALLDGEQLGSLMMQQLAGLIESWTSVLEALAQNGVDPTPLLQTLARTLRDTADQLDPAP
jgi:hypothetical protein